jgi:uroporphyrin-III C-methyltransferase/precorrin-2 dehydrogenase/sirohydrochlorin ferrochelatase
MRYFPIFVDLDGRRVVLAGTGEKAAQKVRLLAKTDASITVVGTGATDEIAALASSGAIELRARPFRSRDLDGAAMAFAADDDPNVNREVAAAAATRGVPVNVVDGPAMSSFIMPAIVDRAPVTVAIGTEGAAPVLARMIKSQIEAWLPANFGNVAAYASRFRHRIQDEIDAFPLRRRIWERLLSGRFRSHALAGNAMFAGLEVAREIAAARNGASTPGAVSLIGCGPGDPDLLTLKAQQRLQEADVLVVDRLVNPAILDYARRDALRIQVGKRAGGPAVPQDEINRILVREALKGHRVARLKGGDAFVFGRAAEEMAAVRAAGIEVEVVPGITAAHAAAASIGLPMTLRGKVRQFSIVTGGATDGALDLDWRGLATQGQAFAIYMGVRSAPLINEKLLAAGADPATPVIIVENATLPVERVVATRLADLAQAMAAKGLRGPAIIFVGLDWHAAHLSRPANVELFDTAAGRRAAARPEDLGAADEIAMAAQWVTG